MKEKKYRKSLAELEDEVEQIEKEIEQLEKEVEQFAKAWGFPSKEKADLLVDENPVKKKEEIWNY